MKNYQENKTQYYANIKAKLSRDIHNRRIAGICAGIAKYFDVDVSLVRITWFLLALFGIFSAGISTFFVISVYFILWFILPKNNTQFNCELGKQ